jgi:hypothetical protein
MRSAVKKFYVGYTSVLELMHGLPLFYNSVRQKESGYPNIEE